MKKLILLFLVIVSICTNCQNDKATSQNQSQSTTPPKDPKPLNADLPIIGLLVYEGVLTTEVTAPMDVFTKPSQSGEPLFEVITIAESMNPLVSEEGLTLLPDYSFENCPDLDVLFVPSAYDMSAQVKNTHLVEFIRAQNQHTVYTVSNCAGAHLIGASGIADGKKIVTWIGGGAELQEAYPQLMVQNDSLVSYVEDGKFLSSNGNLASYISSLELLEKLTDRKHREFVASYLYLDRLQAWEK